MLSDSEQILTWAKSCSCGGNPQIIRKNRATAIKCCLCDLSTNYKFDPYSSLSSWNKSVESSS